MRKITILIVLFLVSCSSYYKPPVLDSESKSFSTTSKIPSNGVLMEEPFQKRYKNIVFVYNTTGDFNFDKYITNSFKNMNIFDAVFTQYEMEQLIFNKNLQDEITSITRVSELQELYNHIGDTLVMRINKLKVREHAYQVSFEVFDAKNGKLVLHIRNYAYLWTGIDEPLYYPMFNAILEWARGDKITTEQTPETFRN